MEKAHIVRCQLLPLVPSPVDFHPMWASSLLVTSCISVSISAKVILLFTEGLWDPPIRFIARNRNKNVWLKGQKHPLCKNVFICTFGVRFFVPCKRNRKLHWYKMCSISRKPPMREYHHRATKGVPISQSQKRDIDGSTCNGFRYPCKTAKGLLQLKDPSSLSGVNPRGRVQS